jgi:hypothetical protein
VNKKTNPLDILNARKVGFCSPLFTTVDISLTYNLEFSIDEWIKDKCSGRYFIGKNVKLDQSNNIKEVYTVGFEKEKELSYFMLACPHLKYQ